MRRCRFRVVGDAVPDAVGVLAQAHIGEAPVVDGRGECAGVLSLADFARRRRPGNRVDVHLPQDTTAGGQPPADGGKNLGFRQSCTLTSRFRRRRLILDRDILN